MPTAELVILNYNGRKHLEELLPTALAEAKAYPGECRVVVIDNRSTDPDPDWVRCQFPQAEVWIAPENDFLFSYNAYASQSQAAILVFLNNDLKLLEGFVSPLIQPFAQNDVFAVSATSRDWENQSFTFGPMQLRSHHGDYYWMPDYERQSRSHTLFASGGFMAVDRLKFLELGGFSRIYHPAYCEDLDLCFRAWRRGWRCLFEPRSKVLHREHGSWNTGSGSRADRLMLRSKLFFEWSSLPPAAGCGERWAYFVYERCRELTRGSGWRLATHFAAWREWQTMRSEHGGSRATLEELDAIMARIAWPA